MNARMELQKLIDALPDPLVDEALHRIIALVEHPDEPWDLSQESELAIREYLEGRAEVVTGKDVRARGE